MQAESSSLPLKYLAANRPFPAPGIVDSATYVLAMAGSARCTILRDLAGRGAGVFKIGLCLGRIEASRVLNGVVVEHSCVPECNCSGSVVVLCMVLVDVSTVPIPLIFQNKQHIK